MKLLKTDWDLINLSVCSKMSRKYKVYSSNFEVLSDYAYAKGWIYLRTVVVI